MKFVMQLTPIVKLVDTKVACQILFSCSGFDFVELSELLFCLRFFFVCVRNAPACKMGVELYRELSVQTHYKMLQCCRSFSIQSVSV